MKPIERFQALLDGKRLRQAHWDDHIYWRLNGVSGVVNHNDICVTATASLFLDVYLDNWELYEEPKPDTYTGWEHSVDGKNWIRKEISIHCSTYYPYSRWVEDGVCPKLEIRDQIKLTPEMVGKRVRLRNGNMTVLETYNPSRETGKNFETRNSYHFDNGSVYLGDYNDEDIVEVYPSTTYP